MKNWSDNGRWYTSSIFAKFSRKSDCSSVREQKNAREFFKFTEERKTGGIFGGMFSKQKTINPHYQCISTTIRLTPPKFINNKKLACFHINTFQLYFYRKIIMKKAVVFSKLSYLLTRQNWQNSSKGKKSIQIIFFVKKAK